MLRFHVTSTGLVLAAVLPEETWLRPLVVANAIVGIVYMLRERVALRDIGSDTIGVGRVRMTFAQQHVVNFATHVVCTLLVLRRMSNRPIDWRRLWIFALLGMFIFDLQGLYPTGDGHSLHSYMLAYLAILLALQVFF